MPFQDRIQLLNPPPKNNILEQIGLNLSIQGVIYLILVALVLYKFPKIINSSQSEIKNFMGSFLAKIF